MPCRRACVGRSITIFLASHSAMHVPVLYAIFVMDLKILKWETKEKKEPYLAPSGVAAD